MALPYFFAQFPDDPDIHNAGRSARSRGREAAPDLPAAEQLCIARIRTGDEEAYDALFVEFYGVLREFCVTYVRSVAIAEEVVQEVFLDLWVRRAEWDPAGGVRPYLFRAVRNRAINAVRNARTAERLAPRGAEEWMGGPPPRPDVGAPDAALEEALAPIIASLPPARRRAAMLRWHFGLSYAEIATIMQTSVASVTKHIARAREDVRPVVERYLKE